MTSKRSTSPSPSDASTPSFSGALWVDYRSPSLNAVLGAPMRRRMAMKKEAREAWVAAQSRPSTLLRNQPEIIYSQSGPWAGVKNEQ